MNILHDQVNFGKHQNNILRKITIIKIKTK